MTVRSAVDHAMQSGGVISRGEFSAIREELIDNIDIRAIDSQGYLIRPEDAEILRGAHFRNEAEQRDFYVGFLQAARDRVEVELLRSLRVLAPADRASLLSCREVVTAQATACFSETEGEVVLRFPQPGVLDNPLLLFIGRQLPRNAFIGLYGTHAPQDLAALQLLDGVYFTVENSAEHVPPPETQISTAVLRSLIEGEFGHP